MKTNYLKSAVMICALILSTTAIAQTTKKRTAYAAQGSTEYGNNTYTYNETNGILHEYVETYWKGDHYEMKLLNGKPTLLRVNDKLIPPAEYGKYSGVIADIRERIKEDRKQAEKDRAQASRDREQAEKDREQAERDRQQAHRDQEEARRQQGDAERDQAQARRDQEQAKRDQEQAARDQEQAKRDQEQAGRDQIQARHDQEQAKEDQRQLELMISDLVSDGIIPNKEALHSMRMNADEMIVNGKKMTDSVFNKYKERYPRFAHGHSDGKNFNGFNMTRGVNVDAE